MKNIFSLGKAESSVHVGEAYTLWAQLQSWYDVLELTESLLNYTDDADLKSELKHCVQSTNTVISKLEDAMQHYKVTFPQRPSKVLKTASETNIFSDQIIYRTIFDIGQAALLVHVNSLNICVNGSLRKLFGEFLSSQIQACDTFVKLGKTKNWLHYPPAYELPE